MKIGILTLHSQLNYGGVLQCWALVQVLKDLGHEVVVVDRWLDSDNFGLERGFNHFGLKTWLKFWIRSIWGCGDFGHWIRYVRTKRFVRSLGLTPYHFHEWKDAPRNLGVDCLVVGSDQVWHCGDWGDPRPYLLEGAPSVKAIAYAASFGMKDLPAGIDYAAGFRRFSAISCRETEGVALVENTGVHATHVVDPTLLVDRKAWSKLVVPQRNQKRLVCYFLSQDVNEALSVIEPWAKREKWQVDVLVLEENWGRPFPKTCGQFVARLKLGVKCLLKSRRVRVRFGYGPREFVQAFARADACIADSFHAVMFSSIYELNLRFLRPQNEMRRQMFARVEEFARDRINGRFFVDDVAQALSSFEHGERIVYDVKQIAAMRSESLAWLSEAIKGK